MGLKQAQAAAHLADDEASALVKEAARARVESLFETAVQCLKQRTRVRDYSGGRGGRGGVGRGGGRCWGSSRWLGSAAMARACSAAAARLCCSCQRR